MDEKLQLLLEKVRSLEEQLRKDGAAPTAADQDGAGARSATKKRKKSKRQRSTEGAEASKERKRQKHRLVQMEGSSSPRLHREPEPSRRQSKRDTVQRQRQDLRSKLGKT